jgi:hypothetical protein
MLARQGASPLCVVVSLHEYHSTAHCTLFLCLCVGWSAATCRQLVQQMRDRVPLTDSAWLVRAHLGCGLSTFCNSQEPVLAAQM